ncbi:helix-turn-helix domain-containing protein [Amorphoplanes nipponensis]|uniref:PucR family transcriptional regulator n=1 Tax=Actinoplanes nipponensis TaxID=135950 RepID=UPI0031EBF0E3
MIPAPARPDDRWLAEVAAGASRDAGDVPVELLGDYLPLLADAAITGRRPKRAELDAVETLGRRAAEQGFSAGRVVQLYLSAARRLWQDLPTVVRSRDREAVRAAAAAVLSVIDDAVATLAEGYAVARRDLVRREETLRRELVDDLLRGDSDLGALVDRAEPFGLDLARAHQVALAAAGRRLPDTDAAISALETVIFDRLGDRDVLVATKDGLLVVLAPADAARAPHGRDATPELGRLMHDQLRRLPRGRPWRVAVGRPHPGLYGIARSYEEAREALTMATRLRLDTPVVTARELLIYRVLLRDQPAIVELVHAVLSPLGQARGGAEPLLATLQAYFDTGAVATETAKRIHVSVRAVTYRLQRIKALTGYDPADPAHRFTLQAAVLGARALDWPHKPLSGSA